MPSLPSPLMECLRLRQAVLVAGARCASLADLPDWVGLAALLAARAQDQTLQSLAADGRTLAALATAREVLPDDVVAEVLRQALPAGRPVPPAIEALARVPFRGVFTTSLDDLWDRALAADARVPTAVLAPGEALALAGFRGRFVAPVLGRASAPETVVLSVREARVEVGAGPTAALLADAHRRFSFVLVGFQPGDPDLALLAGLLGASGSAREHFALFAGATEAQAAIAGAELGLTAVGVEGDLEASLRALTEAWTEVEAASRPAEDDVEGWIELGTRDPADPEPRAVLARAAERLRAEKAWDRLVDLLVHRAELVGDRAEQVASLREVGRILDDELHAPERAYSALVTALRLDPDDAELRDACKAAARKAGLLDQFLDEYGGLVEELGDPADSTRHVLELGRLYAEEAGRDDRAIASYEKVLAAVPDSPEALEALEGLYRKAGRWRDLLRVLESLAARAVDPAELRRLRRERAEVLLVRLGDESADTIAALEAVVAGEPTDRAALAALERLLKGAGRERDVLPVLERLLAAASSDEERIALLRRIASHHRARPEGHEDAVAALEKAYALGDRHEGTLEVLARAFEQRERWADAAAALDRWAEGAVDGHTRAQLLARAGRLHVERMGDPAAGEERYARALELDPENVVVLGAMASFCRARGDHFRAAKFLQDCAERTRNPLEQARLLHEAAVLHQDHLEDPARALELEKRALAADPEHLEAAARLAEAHEREQDWAALEPLLDVLARRAPPGDAAAAALAQRRLGECARRLGKLDKAGKAYEAARALAPESLPVLRGYAELQYEREAWADARAMYDTVLRIGEAALDPGERLAAHVRIARCEAHLDEPEAALRWLEKALALDPPVEDKVGLWEEIGELQLEALARPTDAIHAFEEALALDPRRRPTLHRLLDLYTAEKRWPAAADALGKLAAVEPAPAVRAKYRYAAAVIHRDELGAPDTAVELFNQALDDDPGMGKAFEAIERALTEAQDWKGLARAYRRMIKRLPQEGMTEQRARLWNSLGVVSLRTLGDRDAAVLAFEVATSLEPENLPRRELLADLYVELGPTAAEKAVAQHQFLISRQPDRVESYQALARLYQQLQAFDRLWCVAGVLSYLGHADHYLQQFWDRHRMTEVPVAMGKLTGELWHKVVHPGEDPLVGAVFGLLAPALALTCAQPHSSVGVKRGERIEIERADWFPAVALRYLCTSLDLPAPDVFVRDKDPLTAAIWNLRDKAGLTPALIIGQGFSQWVTQHEVVFDLAKRMAFLRWERFPRFALATPAALDIGLRAAMALGGAPVGNGPHDGEVERTRGKLAQLVPKPLADQLSVVARRFVEERGPVIDVAGWMAAADLTAARAAFVLASDIPAAVRVLGAEPAGLSPLPLTERIKDLLAYSVSEDYFAVRTALGLQVV